MPANGPPIKRKTDAEGNLCLLLPTPIGRYTLIEISHHARERMAEREVDEQDVLSALRHPDQPALPARPGFKRVGWHKTARWTIQVVYQELPDWLRVITVARAVRRLGRRR